MIPIGRAGAGGANGQQLQMTGPGGRLVPVDGSMLWKDQTFKSVLAQFLRRVVIEQSMSAADRSFVQANAIINHAYYRGRQYLDMLATGQGYPATYYSGQPDSASKLTYSPSGSQLSAAMLINYQLPIYKGDVDKFIAVLGTRAPNAEALYNVPGHPAGSQIQRLADRLMPYMKAAWDTDQKQAELVAQYALSGPVWGGVFWEDWGPRNGPPGGMGGMPQPGMGAPGQPGQPEMPPMGPEQSFNRPTGPQTWGCPKCGSVNIDAELIQHQGMCKVCGTPLSPQDMLPSQTTPGTYSSGQMQTNRGMVTYMQGSVTMIEAPFWCKDPEKYPWLWAAREQDRWSLLAKYKRAGYDIDPTFVRMEGNSIGAMAQTSPTQQYSHRYLQTPRAGVAAASDFATSSMGGMGTNHSGGPVRDFWREEMLWVDPDLYSWFDASMDPSGRVAEFFYYNYPTGGRLCYINAVPVAVMDEPPSQHWYQLPGVGEGAYYDALFTPYREVMDAVNIIVDQAVQVMQYAAGDVFFDEKLLSQDYLRNVPARIGRWIPIIVEREGGLSNIIHKVDGADLPEALPKLLETLISIAREAIGITPALFGAGPGDETARAAEIRRTQALAQFNPLWQAIRKYWSMIYRMGARLIARHSDGELWTSQALRMITNGEAAAARRQQQMMQGGIGAGAGMGPGMGGSSMGGSSMGAGAGFMQIPATAPWSNQPNQPSLIGNNPPGFEPRPIYIPRLKLLLDENWKYIVEEEVPLSPGARRNWIEDLFRQMPPALQPALGLIDPMGMPRPQNLHLLREVVQMPDWWLPNWNQYIRIKEMIGQIVAGGDPMLLLDPLLFDPIMVVDVVKDWLLDDAGADLKLDNPMGWERIRMALQMWSQILMAQQAQMAAQQAQMAPGPNGEPAGPDGPGAGPGGPQPGPGGPGGSRAGNGGPPMPPGGPGGGPPGMPAPQPGMQFPPASNPMQPSVEGQGGLAATLPPEMLNPELLVAQTAPLGRFVDLTAARGDLAPMQ